MTTEHCKLTACPVVTVSGAEGLMETGPMFTVWKKITVTNILVWSNDMLCVHLWRALDHTVNCKYIINKL